MSQEKRGAAETALEFVTPGMIVGVGTGSTVAHFIDGLARLGRTIAGAVASSEATARLLRARGIVVLDLNDCGPLPLYVDGADLCDRHHRLIKGGGAALTREKIVAAASRRFVCIIEPAKQVEVLAGAPLPVEVVPMARALVMRELAQKTGENAVWREGVVTDNGGWIVDVHGLTIEDPVGLEAEINQIPGVVAVGLFARRPADVVIVGNGAPRSRDLAQNRS